VNHYSGKEYIDDSQQILEIFKNDKREFISDSSTFSEQIKIYKHYLKNRKSNVENFSKKGTINNFSELMEVWNKGNIQEFEFDTIKYFTKTEPPKLILWGDTKGMHCCRELYVFELGEKFREITIIYSSYLDLESLKFKDIDKDGIPEISFYTNSWRYWRNSAGAEEPILKTILKYKNGNYHIYKEKMAKPMPDSTKLKKWVKECRRLGEDINFRSTIWSYMLEMIYGGHYRQAIEFSVKAWPPKVKGYDIFLKDFDEQLTCDPYDAEMKEWGK